ncbi:hypothetical protein B1B04_08360 [Lysinibacillus sp. KCTC 33748]|uniref:hypothetical protein n=1 Tax=unclassified Lysinibacillus TaxID=2636778 RepID=UPI0009A6D59B|nr:MULTISPECIES: hypothetical protein [unclassified Lysinibacillus]OXS74893.1 hypothetical protein B1B04_08360 [Lysinibacillus sp. KCTC 33748]SKB59388.1 hypothetical protein SAMN06295926_104153 [Lysinibacillus sp. AC-3]
MTLKDKLLKTSRNAIEDYAIRFACNIEPKLAEEARDGRTEYIVSIANEHHHILTSPLFLSVVNDLLDGVNVSVIRISASQLIPSIKKDVLQVSWGDLND